MMPKKRAGPGRLVFIPALFLAGCAGRALPAAEPFPGIAFVSERDGNAEIYRIGPDGSEPVRLTEHTELDADPGWSPDGRQIVFRSQRDGSSDLFVMGADGSGPRNLIGDPADSFDDEFAPAWNPGGQLLALFTDRFPPAGRCASGVHQLALFPIGGSKEDIRQPDVQPGEQVSFAWSPDGASLVFSSGCNAPHVQLFQWEQASGEVRQLTRDPYHHTYPAWSHDGRFLAFVSNREGNSDVYRLEIASGEVTNLTRNPALDTQPSWSPDDQRIAFATNRDGNSEIYLMGAGGENPRNLTSHPARDYYPAWSPVP
jgi:TolB protein